MSVRWSVRRSDGWSVCHSTETALLKITKSNNIMETIDFGQITILTALDISAAFDTLDHITLLHILLHTLGLSDYFIS